MRRNAITWHSALFLSRQSQLRVRQSNPDLLGGYAWKFNANEYFRLTFTEVDGWRPRRRSERRINLHRLLESSKQTTDAIAQPLQFQSLEPCGAYVLNHSTP